MSISDVIAEIDSEIARLQQARHLLSGAVSKRGPGRPAATSTATRRPLSAAARAKIAAAQRARWAKHKKSS
jgi:hypothetical protein